MGELLTHCLLMLLVCLTATEAVQYPREKLVRPVLYTEQLYSGPPWIHSSYVPTSTKLQKLQCVVEDINRLEEQIMQMEKKLTSTTTAKLAALCRAFTHVACVAQNGSPTV